MTNTTTPDADENVDATLSALSKHFGNVFDITAEQIREHRSLRKKEGLSADACALCDVPDDVCTEGCDAGDWKCNNQHDIVCVKCDEGDVCTKEDGSCNLAGDIPCGKDDK